MNPSTLDTLWKATRAAQDFARRCHTALCCCEDCLAGTCAIAATHAAGTLRSKGFDVWLEMCRTGGDGAHCWLSLMVDGRPYVVDPTAMQFSCGSPRPTITDALIEPRFEYVNRFFVEDIFINHGNDNVVNNLQNWGDQSPWDYYELIPTLEAMCNTHQSVVGF